jgi:hypothetical protein
MSAFTFISPVHIGSGETYENFLLSENKRYDFDAVVSKAFETKRRELLDPGFLTQLASLGQDKSGRAKEAIRRVLVPTHDVFEGIPPLYEISYKLNRDKLKEKDVSAFTRTLGKAYIPGSSIKGYLMNVIFFDMFRHDHGIRKRMTDKLTAAVNELYRNASDSTPPKIGRSRQYRDLERSISNAMFAAGQHLTCRDVAIPSPLSLYFVNRETKKRGSIPQILECADYDNDFSTPDEVIIVNDLKRDRPKLDDLGTMIHDAVVSRIRSLRENLYEMNLGFITNTIRHQDAFIKRISKKSGSKINVEEMGKMFRQIEDALEDREIVMQIGKLTNHITKSSSMGLGDEFYTRYFRQIFRSDKNKDEPGIGTMNLVQYADFPNDYDQIPGYVIFRW